jgi:hypothetical protein
LAGSVAATPALLVGAAATVDASTGFFASELPGLAGSALAFWDSVACWLAGTTCADSGAASSMEAATAHVISDVFTKKGR